MKETFETPEEESITKFSRAKEWVGIRIKEGEARKYGLPIFGDQTESEILFGAQNKKSRIACIKHKVEIFCAINSEDYEVIDHYVTISNGVIFWFKTE